MFRQSIYDTRRPEHPHSPILQYERRPQGPSSRPRYIRRKYKPNVAFFPSAEVALVQRRVHRQELVALLYCGVVRLAHVLG